MFANFYKILEKYNRKSSAKIVPDANKNFLQVSSPLHNSTALVDTMDTFSMGLL